MIYGQDFDSFRWLGLSWGCIICCYFVLQCIMQMDTAKDTIKFVKVHRKWKVTGVVASGICTCLLCKEDYRFVLLLSIVAACLLMACVTDVETRLIYNYVWWIGGGAGVLLVLVSDSNSWIAICLFFMLQELFFSKLYGRADCHGFVVCSLTESAFGMGMREYLMHMLFAFFLLGVVQAAKHNVRKNGNLKKPVPFLPYMAIAFWVNLIVF